MRRTPPLAALVLLGMVHSLRAAPDAPAAPGQVPFPGGIADLGGRTAYVAGAHGGIDAIDLTTGDLLWETTEAQRPLLLAGDHLYAQAGLKRNRLRVLRFDLTRRGECVLESDPVVLPAWVVTGEAPGRSFQARWRLDKHLLVLDWQARAWHPGRQPTPEQERAARQNAAGQARIDLRAGRVEILPPVKPAAAETVMFPLVDKIALRWHGVVGTRRVALVLEEVEPLPEPPTPAARKTPGDSKAPTPAVPPTPPVPKKMRREHALVLRSWDRATYKLLSADELLRGDRLLVKTTLDERYLFLRDAPPSPDMQRTNDPRWHSWEVFAAANGKRVARIAFTPGTEAVAILGTRAYALVSGPLRGPLDRPGVRPRTLQALDLTTGAVVWQRAVGGKSYHVPPPSPRLPPPAKPAPQPARKPAPQPPTAKPVTPGR